MFLRVLICAAATAGLLLFLWCLIGLFLLPIAGKKKPLYVLFPASADAPDLEHEMRAFHWLCETGLLYASFIIIDDGLNSDGERLASSLAKKENAQLCKREMLQSALEGVTMSAEDRGNPVR